MLGQIRGPITALTGRCRLIDVPKSPVDDAAEERPELRQQRAVEPELVPDALARRRAARARRA